MFELVQLLKNKKTGKYQCPYCLKRLENRDNIIWECRKCKMYFGMRKQEVKK